MRRRRPEVNPYAPYGYYGLTAISLKYLHTLSLIYIRDLM
jgi:hypothetical protein